MFALNECQNGNSCILLKYFLEHPARDLVFHGYDELLAFHFCQALNVDVSIFDKNQYLMIRGCICYLVSQICFLVFPSSQRGGRIWDMKAARNGVYLESELLLA